MTPVTFKIRWLTLSLFRNIKSHHRSLDCQSSFNYVTRLSQRRRSCSNSRVTLRCFTGTRSCPCHSLPCEVKLKAPQDRNKLIGKCYAHDIGLSLLTLHYSTTMSLTEREKSWIYQQNRVTKLRGLIARPRSWRQAIVEAEVYTWPN